MSQAVPPMVVLAAHPNPELYGADRVFLETVAGLVAQGHRVVATLPERGPLWGELERRGAEVRFGSTPVLRKSARTPLGLVRLGGAAARDLVAGLAFLRRVRPDVVYVSTVTIPLWLVVARLRRIPVLSHVHEAERSVSRASKLALVAPLLLADAIVANSRFSAGVLTDTFPQLGRKTVVVYNGVPGPAERVDPRMQVHGPFKVLYVGRLSRRKGVDVLIEAMALLRDRGVDAHLDIVGAVYPGYEWYEAQLRELVAARQVQDSVTFHGFCPDVWPFLAGTDAAVVPSRIDEPFGNTAVEAILAARPLVVSDCAGLREAAGGYRTALHVGVERPVEIADALERIRNEWTSFRLAAIDDAATAAARHSTTGYQRRMATALTKTRRREVPAGQLPDAGA